MSRDVMSRVLMVALFASVIALLSACEEKEPRRRLRHRLSRTSRRTGLT